MGNGWKWALIALLVVAGFATVQWLAPQWPHGYAEGLDTLVDIR